MWWLSLIFIVMSSSLQRCAHRGDSRLAQESFGGGWLMCYTSAGSVDIANEHAYDVRLPYGVDGYR